MEDVMERDNKRCRIIAAVVSSIFICGIASKNFIVEGRLGNRTDADYDAVVRKILKLKQSQRLLFTRIYRLSPTSFDKTLAIIEPDLLPKKPTAKHFVPAIIKLCLGLRVLAGGSYLDLSFGYDVPHGTVHHYAWQALHAIDRSADPFLDNIKSPIYATPEQLEALEEGFAKMSNFKLRGTIAAGDGIVFRMIMPTNEEVDGDVTSYFTRKGYYAYGLQVSCRLC
jgi:hypothetical protein